MGTSGLLLDRDTHFKMIFALLLLQLVFVFNGKGKHFLIETKDDVVKDDVVKDDATHFNEEEVDDVLDALPDEERNILQSKRHRPRKNAEENSFKIWPRSGKDKRGRKRWKREETIRRLYFSFATRSIRRMGLPRRI